MPFSVKRYGTRAKMNKMKRCVKAVGTRGKVNPYAVCRASIYGKKSTKRFHTEHRGKTPHYQDIMTREMEKWDMPQER